MPNSLISFSVCLVALCLFFSSYLVAQDGGLVINGNFAEWNDDGPIGWELAVGASNGKDTPLSIVKQGDGPSLEISGDANTMAWQSISQTLNIKGGKSYRFRFAGKTADLKREGRQFENCYIGLLQQHERGQVLSRQYLPQSTEDYQEASIVFRTHGFAAKAQIVIFLSKTGTLNIKDVSVEELSAKDSFQILVDEMDRNYSYFDHKEIDWPKLTAKYRERAEAADNDGFTEVVSEMLAEIKDIHIWLEHRRQRVSKFVSRFDANYDFPVVDKSLKDVKQFGDLGITGITKDGFGYIRIVSFAIDPNLVQQMAEDIRERLFDTPGIIIDSRRNPGGSEVYAQQLGSLFADEERVYATSKFRSGVGHGDFYEAQPRRVIQAETVYTRPVVCLIGPGAVSSAEGFALIMKALPHVNVIGLPTRGASGNPQPVQLPNGVDVWFSRWVAMTPDGAPIEDNGVTPDETVEHGEGDPTYTRAIELLKKSKK
jgi:hypothetical protein